MARRGKGAFITTDEANFDCGETYNILPEGEYRECTLVVDHREFKPNAFGLWQMHGNVLEWCGDDWEENYDSDRSQAPFLNDPRSDCRVLRGGSWYYGPQVLRSAFRLRYGPVWRDKYVGFRPARTLTTS